MNQFDHFNFNRKFEDNSNNELKRLKYDYEEVEIVDEFKNCDKNIVENGYEAYFGLQTNKKGSWIM